jgi:RNA polymerase sigma-70 factor, ECF subfamily
MARERDTDLALRHLDGDPEAFGALIDRYQDRLFKFLLPRAGNRKRAEDLAMEVFVRAFRYFDQFDPATKFSSWILAIAANVADNELLGRQRRNGHKERWVVVVAARVKRLLRGRKARSPRGSDRRTERRRGGIERRRQG